MKNSEETPVVEKIFIQGSAREITGQFGSFFNIQINKESFNQMPTDMYGNVRITMNQFKNGANKYGDTHYLTLNTYKKVEKEDERI